MRHVYWIFYFNKFLFILELLKTLLKVNRTSFEFIQLDQNPIQNHLISLYNRNSANLNFEKPTTQT